MKTRIICVYYGDLPEWFNLWLVTCQNNREFSFLFVTDQMYKGILPSNVDIKIESFDELKRRFEHALGIDICLKSPYKICDYRPIFGLAFKKELTGFDFWGHCDLDMVFGKLSKYITNDFFEEYDRIGLYGALTLYKNSEKMNNLFRERGSFFSWRTVFSNDENFIFDEMPGINSICVKQKIVWEKSLHRADIDRYLTRMSADRIKDHEAFTLENGYAKHYYKKSNRLFVDEVAYIHFSGKRPIMDESVNPYKPVIIKSHSIEELTQQIDSLEILRNYSEFLDTKEDRRQRRRHVKTKLVSFWKCPLKKRLIQGINFVMIKIFYRKIKSCGY